MKKIAFTFIISVIYVLALNSTSDAKGNSKKRMNYDITPIENLYLGSDVVKAWSITYAKGNDPVTVLKKSDKNEINYIVRSKLFELSYVAKSSGFGAKKLKKKWRALSQRTTVATIDMKQLRNQKIITPRKVNEQKALELIANYLPDLIKTHVIRRIN